MALGECRRKREFAGSWIALIPLAAESVHIEEILVSLLQARNEAGPVTAPDVRKRDACIGRPGVEVPANVNCGGVLGPYAESGAPGDQRSSDRNLCEVYWCTGHRNSGEILLVTAMMPESLGFRYPGNKEKR